MDVRFSITIRQHARLRELIEAIPEEDWTPVPYMDGRRRRRGPRPPTLPSQGEPEAAPVRLIVRRVKYLIALLPEVLSAIFNNRTTDIRSRKRKVQFSHKVLIIHHSGHTNIEPPEMAKPKLLADQLVDKEPRWMIGSKIAPHNPHIVRVEVFPHRGSGVSTV